MTLQHRRNVLAPGEDEAPRSVTIKSLMKEWWENFKL